MDQSSKFSEEEFLDPSLTQKIVERRTDKQSCEELTNYSLTGLDSPRRSLLLFYEFDDNRLW